MSPQYPQERKADRLRKARTLWGVPVLLVGLVLILVSLARDDGVAHELLYAGIFLTNVGSGMISPEILPELVKALKGRRNDY